MQWLVKIWVRLGLLLYCKKIYISRKEDHRKKVPTLLACNHPNSFLDALIIGSHYPQEIYFLARGDAFKKAWVAKILHGLNMIPVYRISEGKDNLENNADTFKQCMDVLKRNETLLIFSEGICINEWKLRPLKKGTARIAYLAWFSEEISEMKVLPTGISYDSFDLVPKTVWVNENNFLNKQDFEETDTARFYNQFNKVLSQKINKEILTKEEAGVLENKENKLKKILLALPAFIGWLTQKWFYVFWRNLAKKKTINTVFYDSVLFGLLLITYPLFVLIFCIISSFFSMWSWSLFFLFPLTAWCYKEYKSL